MNRQQTRLKQKLTRLHLTKPLKRIRGKKIIGRIDVTDHYKLNLTPNEYYVYLQEVKELDESNNMNNNDAQDKLGINFDELKNSIDKE